MLIKLLNNNYLLSTGKGNVLHILLHQTHLRQIGLRGGVHLKRLKFPRKKR